MVFHPEEDVGHRASALPLALMAALLVHLCDVQPLGTNSAKFPGLNELCWDGSGLAVLKPDVFGSTMEWVLPAEALMMEGGRPAGRPFAAEKVESTTAISRTPILGTGNQSGLVTAVEIPHPR